MSEDKKQKKNKKISLPVARIIKNIGSKTKNVTKKFQPAGQFITKNVKKVGSKFGFLKKAINKRIMIIVTLFLVAIYLVSAGVFAVGVYKYNWAGKAKNFAINVYPFPASYIGGHIIWYKSFQREYDHAKFFAEKTNKTASNEDEFKKGMLDQMINLEVWKIQARKNGVKVSADDYNSSYNKLIEEAGGEDKAKEMLQEFWQMSLPDLKRLIKDQLPKEKLAEKLQDEILVSVKARHILIKDDENLAREVAKKAKEGAKFEDLVNEYTQDVSTKERGGDLGFFNRGVMDVDFENAAFAMKPGDISDPIKTTFGFHIIKVEERKGTIDKTMESWFNEVRNQTRVYKFTAK